MPRVAVTLHNNAPPRDLPEHIHRHVPHYCALEAATHAWNRVLVDAFDGEFDPVTDIALVNVNSNFSGELFTDAAEVGVEVAKIGTTSVTLRVEIVQGGTRAADLSVTLVQVGGTVAPCRGRGRRSRSSPSKRCTVPAHSPIGCDGKRSARTGVRIRQNRPSRNPWRHDG